jgi:hypothetical protein
MNWQIATLTRSLPDGLVITSHWRLTHTDGEHTGSVYGTVTLPEKDPTDPSFVPFDQITEAQAIEWTKDAIGADTVAAHEAAVLAQIAAQQNPTSASGLPW